MRIFARGLCGFVLGSVLAFNACGGGGGSAPTAPSPAPQSFAVSGKVSETTPTQDTGIDGTRVEVTTGPAAGRSVTANSSGNYGLSGLAGQVTLRASRDGYETLEKSVQISGDSTVHFSLLPQLRYVDETIAGSVGESDEKCGGSFGLFEGRCRTHLIPVHRDGSFDATLSWDNRDGSDLGFTFLREDGQGTAYFTINPAGRSEVRMTGFSAVGGHRYALTVSLNYWKVRVLKSYQLSVRHPY